jgi:hypothetical protein
MEILNKNILDALISHIEPITGYPENSYEIEALKRAFEITLCEYLINNSIKMQFAYNLYICKAEKC